MKTSLNSKVLFLSLTAILAVSGCERRGRAPVKADAPSEQSKSNAAAPGTGTKPGTTTTTDNKTPTTDNTTPATPSTNPEMNCAIALPAGDAVNNAYKFKTDVDAYWSFRDCLVKSGLNLVFVKKTDASSLTPPTYLISQSDPSIAIKVLLEAKDFAEAGKVNEDASSLSREFYKLSRARKQKDGSDSNDTIAAAILGARLDVLKAQNKRFADRYAKIDPKLSTLGDNPMMVSDILSDLANLDQLAEDARKLLGKLRTVSDDGEDMPAVEATLSQ